MLDKEKRSMNQLKIPSYLVTRKKKRKLYYNLKFKVTVVFVGSLKKEIKILMIKGSSFKLYFYKKGLFQESVLFGPSSFSYIL